MSRVSLPGLYPEGYGVFGYCYERSKCVFDYTQGSRQHSLALESETRRILIEVVIHNNSFHSSHCGRVFLMNMHLSVKSSARVSVMREFLGRKNRPGSRLFIYRHITLLIELFLYVVC